MAAMEWDGRPVVFADLSIRQGDEVLAVCAEDGRRGTYACLVATLRYADTNEPVFRSIDELLDGQPFRLKKHATELARDAFLHNGMLGDQPTLDGEEPPGPSL